MAKLDKSKDYGTVYGSTDGVAFEQDGKQFDIYGAEIVRGVKQKPATQTAKAPTLAEQPAVTGDNDQIAEQLKG